MTRLLAAVGLALAAAYVILTIPFSPSRRHPAR